MWFRTVGSAISSCLAIAFAESPWSISASTSSCRARQPCRLPGGGSPIGCDSAPLRRRWT